MRKIFIITIVTAVLASLSCSTTRITSSWKNPESSVYKYKKIMVIALVKENDHALKQKMEEHMVGDLKAKGIDAISAYGQYGPKAFENLEEQTVLDKIQNSGADAIITIVLLDKARERYYVSGHIRYTPYAFYYNRFWGYYTTIHRRIYSPGYYVTNTEYFWESNLYDASSKELVYSVQSRSFDPASADELSHEYGQLIVNDIFKNGKFAGA